MFSGWLRAVRAQLRLRLEHHRVAALRSRLRVNAIIAILEIVPHVIAGPTQNIAATASRIVLTEVRRVFAYLAESVESSGVLIQYLSLVGVRDLLE